MKEFDPQHAAKHGYTREDWDAVDNPEWTDEELAQARPFVEVFPDLAEKIRKSIAGRPKSAHPKIAVSLRLDPDVVQAFKAEGPGWQSRMNQALRKAAGV
jgi:uncharacterized protein (DUF4415 family)